MPIIRTNGHLALFIHVPKTGGTAISEALVRLGKVAFVPRKRPDGRFRRWPGFEVTPNHMHGAMLRSLFPDGFFSHAFMVVRHPVDRIISEYKYRLKIAQTFRAPRTIKIFERRFVTHREGIPGSFTKWLKRSLRRRQLDPFVLDNHIRPQVEFEAFNPIVYRFEDGVDNVLADMCSRLGIDAGVTELITRVNSSDGCEVSDGDRALIMDAYQCDFEKYGYR